MRRSEPWWRESKRAWYCEFNGKQRSLGKDKDEAYKKFYRLMADEGLAEPQDLTVALAFDNYLEYCKRFPKNTYRNRKQLLQKFLDRIKKSLKVSELKSHHLQRFLDAHDWSDSMKRSAVNYVLAALNWNVKQGYLPDNPLKHFEKPAFTRRKAALSPADQQKLIDAASGPFREILIALKETGARPSELGAARIECCDLEAGIILLEEHKEDDSGDPRILYLTPLLRERIAELIQGREEGYIWRNSEGNPWRADTIFCRFKRLRTKLGIKEGVFPYACRSRFITSALERGVDPISVSSLVGHKRLDMIKKHYARLGKDHLKEAAEKATKE